MDTDTRDVRSRRQRSRLAGRPISGAEHVKPAISNCTSGSHKALDPDLHTADALPKKTRKRLLMIGIAGFHPAHTRERVAGPGDAICA
jgi:hypothetical protein